MTINTEARSFRRLKNEYHRKGEDMVFIVGSQIAHLLDAELNGVRASKKGVFAQALQNVFRVIEIGESVLPEQMPSGTERAVTRILSTSWDRKDDFKAWLPYRNEDDQRTISAVVGQEAMKDIIRF